VGPEREEVWITMRYARSPVRIAGEGLPKN
jgi:hypothetical protein